ncbi:hypothetical protein MnTg03_01496 [bacterium MnTg03]|nr:hypothetical protein MnTg03_01496 [bacterium MnTg03]
MKTVQVNYQFLQQYQPLPRQAFASAGDFIIRKNQAIGEKQKSL